MEDATMIGKRNPQFSILDGVFNSRTKRSRSDALLDKINNFVDWKKLAALSQGVFKDTTRGRPTIPVEFSLKCLFLQYLYNLSDPALEDALIDRLSFQRFLGISFDRDIPDFSTIWRFRERLVKTGILDRMFDMLLADLEEKKLVLRRGTLVDATIVQAARKQRKEEEAGDENTSETPRQMAQRDCDATTTKKGKTFYYGYKGHIGMDEGSGIIRKKRFTTASVHDSTEFDNLVSGDERSVFSDKAYANDERKREFRKNGIFCGILDKAKRNHPLSGKQKKDNVQKSRVRSAVERPFAHFKHLYGYVRTRYVTLKRNDCQFTFLCMISNIRRGIALSASSA
jgi:IS5 family transposase